MVRCSMNIIEEDRDGTVNSQQQHDVECRSQCQPDKLG